MVVPGGPTGISAPARACATAARNGRPFLASGRLHPGMRRRALLARVAGAAVAGLAGCVGGGQSSDGAGAPTGSTDAGTAGAPAGTGTGAAATGTPTSDSASQSVAGVDLPVAADALTRATGRDAIPAITEPAFGADWRGRDVGPLQPDDEVVGVTRGGDARAYPLRVLNWHEVVNDAFGGPLLVTYCPLCDSGVTVERTVRGEPTTFGVTGLLWRANLVMYDAATDSRWSQLAAAAIRGPATGRRLSLVPSRLTTWGTWRRDHPDTEVLLPPPASTTVAGRVSRNYDADPYSRYRDSAHIGTGGEVPVGPGDLHPKTRVVGVADGGAARAYPLPAVRAAGVVNDVVGDLPVVVAVAADGTTLVAYDRRVDGRRLRFERAAETHLRADGSRWTVAAGRAVDGPHEGTALAPATDRTAEFWFAWRAFHPDTTVYDPDG